MTVALDRHQSANPAQKLATPGTLFTITVKGVPAIVNFSFPKQYAGTFLLLSPNAAYPSIQPPYMGVRVASTGYLSTTLGPEGQATIRVPAGVPYFLTCWVPTTDNNKASFTRHPSEGSTSIGSSFNPQQQINITDPATYCP